MFLVLSDQLRQQKKTSIYKVINNTLVIKMIAYTVLCKSKYIYMHLLLHIIPYTFVDLPMKTYGSILETASRHPLKILQLHT